MTPMLIQIVRWLMQPKVWRFVSFASSVVGLLCYALSSSFHRLFGRWTSWKIFLFIVLSFIICVSLLFEHTWSSSASFRLKAHLAFLVLTITSVYSFFVDKVVRGKPDAYSVISCACFAIMSLSLSRQTHCGIAVDLLYFFSGILIAQLMKIKLLLAIVGVGFSYSLTILRCSFNADTDSAPVSTSNVQPTNGVQHQTVIRAEDETNTDTAIQVDDPPQANTNTVTDNGHSLETDDDTDSAPVMTFDVQPTNGVQDQLVIKVENQTNTGTASQVDDPPQANTNTGTDNTPSIETSADSDGGFVKLQLRSWIEAIKKMNGELDSGIFKQAKEYLEGVVESRRLNQIRLLPDENEMATRLPWTIMDPLLETVGV